MANTLVRLACGLSIVAMSWLLALELAPWNGRTVGFMLFWALLALALAARRPLPRVNE